MLGGTLCSRCVEGTTSFWLTGLSVQRLAFSSFADLAVSQNIDWNPYKPMKNVNLRFLAVPAFAWQSHHPISGRGAPGKASCSDSEIMRNEKPQFRLTP